MQDIDLDKFCDFNSKIKNLEEFKKTSLLRLQEAQKFWNEKRICLESIKKQRDRLQKVNDGLQIKLENLKLEKKKLIGENFLLIFN